MKRLHKKIGVGVLVAGLLIGGVSFSSGSVSYASSEESLLLSGLESVWNELGAELPPDIKAFLQGDIKGALNYYGDSLLKEVLLEVHDSKGRDVVGSIFGLRGSGNYSVVKVKAGGKQYSVPFGGNNWDYKLEMNLNDFIGNIRNRGNKLKSGFVYNLIIEGEYEFVIMVH